VQLIQLPMEQLLARCSITDWRDAGYIRSEALLYLALECPASSSRDRESLCRTVLKRVRGILGARGHTDPRAIDRAADHFTDLFIKALAGPCEDMDFYEAQFKTAVVSDLLDAVRALRGEDKSLGPLSRDDDDGHQERLVERAAGSFENLLDEMISKKDYWDRWYSAIVYLAPLQQRIMHLSLERMPVESNDPEKMTISKALKKTPKTIRSHLNMALATLKDMVERGRHS
jgi:hypothetical protein